MKENVGGADHTMRIVLGPLMLSAGHGILGGRRGNALGLATMIAGAMVTETYFTRTCPVNAVLGIDTTAQDEKGTTPESQ